MGGGAHDTNQCYSTQKIFASTLATKVIKIILWLSGSIRRSATANHWEADLGSSTYLFFSPSSSRDSYKRCRVQTTQTWIMQHGTNSPL